MADEVQKTCFTSFLRMSPLNWQIFHVLPLSSFFCVIHIIGTSTHRYMQFVIVWSTYSFQKLRFGKQFFCLWSGGM